MTSLPAARSTTDRHIAGVCGALAARWDIDPVLARVLAVVLALSSGVGLVAYAIAWVWWPLGTDTAAPVDRWLPGLRRAHPVVLALIALVLALPAVMLMSTLTPFGFGSALILGITWWVCAGRHQRRARHGAAPMSGPLPHPDAFREPTGLASEFAPSPRYPAPSPVRPPVPAASAPAPRRTGRMVGWALTVLLLGLAAVGAVLLVGGNAAMVALTFGLPLVCLAAGIAGLLASRPPRRTP